MRILRIEHVAVGALNWATGETVAVKEIQLANIPKAELGEIMVCDVRLHQNSLLVLMVHQSEIDLLKNLNVRNFHIPFIPRQ